MTRMATAVVVALGLLFAGVATPRSEAAVPSLASLDLLVLDIAVNDLVYDQSRKVFYGSVPSSNATHPNRVIAFDELGDLVWSVFVGSEPTVLAMSSDSSVLYVGLDGTGGVARVNLSTRKVNQTFSLGSGSFGPRFPEDLVVLPGQPNVVAVSMYRKSVSPRHDGVAIFEGGVQRTDVTQDHTGSNRIERANNAGRLYGYNNETTEFGFRRLAVNGDGVTELDTTENLISGFDVDIVFASGRIYSSGGRVINPETRTLLGTFSLPTFGRAVAPDPAAGHVFFLHDQGGVSITKFNSTTFAHMDTREIPEAVGSPRGLIRWGGSGLALFTEEQVVVLGDLGFATISGRVLSDTGTPTSQGRAEVYDSDLNHLATYSTGSQGGYRTDGLPPGDYYVLLYNGDDEFFVDFFSEWWQDAPRLRLDQARIVRVAGQDVTGIDARLNPLFLDMFDNIFLDDIAFMQEVGVTKGCNPPVNDLYCPADFVTRGQMAAFLVRALGYTDDGGGDLFIDDDGSTFEADIDRLGTAGVTRGCNPPANDRFCPEDFVTRGQMAAFLVRALGYTDDGGGDLFIDDDGSTFEADIDRLGTAGVTRGCNPPANDRFCPEDFVTRGQMAAFVHRALTPLLSLASTEQESGRGFSPLR